MTDQLRQRLIGTTGGLSDPSWEILGSDWSNLSTHMNEGTSDNGAADMALFKSAGYWPFIAADRIRLKDYASTNNSTSMVFLREPYTIDMTKRFCYYVSYVLTYTTSISFQSSFSFQIVQQSRSYNASTGSFYSSSTYSDMMKGWTGTITQGSAWYTTGVMLNRPTAAGVDYNYPFLTRTHSNSNDPSTYGIFYVDYDPSTKGWETRTNHNVSKANILANGLYTYKPTSAADVSYTWDYAVNADASMRSDTIFYPAFGAGNTSTNYNRGGGVLIGMGVKYL
mgnify:FL=1